MLGRLNLIVTAIVFEAYGFWALLAPVQAAAGLGLDIATIDGRTAIRAIYGGYLIGAGLLFAGSALTVATVRYGLFATLSLVGPILAARLLGLGLDGIYSGPHLPRVAMEASSIVVTVILLIQDRSSKVVSESAV